LAPPSLLLLPLPPRVLALRASCRSAASNSALNSGDCGEFKMR
jgi:hypothetical protein